MELMKFMPGKIRTDGRESPRQALARKTLAIKDLNSQELTGQERGGHDPWKGKGSGAACRSARASDSRAAPLRLASTHPRPSRPAGSPPCRPTPLPAPLAAPLRRLRIRLVRLATPPAPAPHSGSRHGVAAASGRRRLGLACRASNPPPCTPCAATPGHATRSPPPPPRRIAPPARRPPDRAPAAAPARMATRPADVAPTARP
nr:uncharacterized protein LOC127303102 [Lolium perenne]